ncbi:Rv1733c family protein [Streptomyces sp. NPDC002778]
MALRGPLRGPRVWWWRWRRNPLKRRADAVESWVLLGAGALTVLVGVAVGLATAGSIEHGLARERAEWRPVRARLTAHAPGVFNGERMWAQVSWTAPDGSHRTGQVRVRPGSEAGTAVTVWTDRTGRLVTEPATAAQARSRAALAGGLVGAGAAVVPFAGGRMLRGRLKRQRIDQWETEWTRFGPLWGRTTG